MALCCTISMIVRKDVIENIGYLDENLKSWQDDDIVINVGMHYRIGYCNKVVAVIVNSKNSIATNYKNVYIGCKQLVDKHKYEIIHETSYTRYCIWKLRIGLLYLKYRSQNCRSEYIKLIYKLEILFLHKYLRKYFRHMYV